MTEVLFPLLGFLFALVYCNKEDGYLALDSDHGFRFASDGIMIVFECGGSLLKCYYFLLVIHNVT